LFLLPHSHTLSANGFNPISTVRVLTFANRNCARTKQKRIDAPDSI